MKVRIGLGLDEDLLKRVDEARGDVPRTRFIERALEERLIQAEGFTPEQIATARYDEPEALQKAHAGFEREAQELRVAAIRELANRPYRCPIDSCDWPGASSENAKCPSHGRAVVPR